MNIIERAYSLNGTLEKRAKTDSIYLHHAVYNGPVEDIDRMHKNRGWTCIGYHFYVRKDGSIYRGRREDTIGAHAYGYNRTSIGICAEGNFETDIMSEAQKKAIIELIIYLKNKYAITKILRHKDVNATACPGRNYPYEEIVAGVNKTEITEKDDTKADNSYLVKITANCLNIRAGAGTNYKIKGQITDKGTYTIVETQGNWGRLKSGAGWICLDYTNKQGSKVYYKVTANSGLWLLDANGRKIKAYIKDTEVEYLGEGYTKYGYNYIKVKVNGNIGYMAKTYLK